MRWALVIALALVASIRAARTDPDLPGPSANLTSIPAGSLVIPMDNAKQAVVSPFNRKAYGLVTDLLHADIPVDWAIRAGKAKDGIDFTVKARRIAPTVIAEATLDFRGGPFIVHRDFAAFALPRITAFGNNVAVYELTEDATIDIRYTLVHKPKVATLNDGGNANIHEDVLSDAGFVSGTHYVRINATTLATLDASTCFTIATEPHWDDSAADAAAQAVRSFVTGGGNFLAQCVAITTYENNAAFGHFQSTLGVVENNKSDSFLYPNPDLSYSQLEGVLDTGGGTIHDYKLAVGSTWQNNAHLHAQDTPTTDTYAATASKLTGGTGSLVFYLGNHSYGTGNIANVNGRRMYLNAVMTPVARPQGCLLNLTLRNVSGKVYEDIDGDSALGDGMPVSGVPVRLYADTDDSGTVNAGDTFVSEATTDGTGSYGFVVSVGLSGSKYLVAVDSRSVAPSAGLKGGFVQGDVWAEQTYGDDASTPALDVGPRFGGGDATVSDGFNSASTDPASNVYEHLARVDVGAADAMLVDFAFSFNVLTETRDGDDDVAANRTVQGSLRQFLQNANAISGANAMRFVPASAPGESGSGGNWWKVGVNASLGRLPVISDDTTTLDGTAYELANGTVVRDTNPGEFVHPLFGAVKDVGTGPDGIEGSGDEPQLPSYDRPELEIDGSDLGIILEIAGNNVTVKRVALHNTNDEAIFVSGGAGSLVTECFVGSRADGTDPGAGLRVTGHGIDVDAGAADVTNNLLSYIEELFIKILDTSLVNGNELHASRSPNTTDDGISVEQTTGQTITIRENRIDQVPAYGIESFEGSGPWTIENNTISRSGQISTGDPDAEDGGIRVFGEGSTVRHNVVTASAGAGIVVVQSTGSNQQNLISENAIYGNGTVPSTAGYARLGIDIDRTHVGGPNPNGDSVTPNDGALDPNDPNNAMDYPIFTVVLKSGSNLHVEGYVGTPATKVAGTHTIEVFKADDDGDNDGPVVVADGLSVPHGEGRWFIDSCPSAADGTFSCDLTIPAAVVLAAGDPVTATATTTDVADPDNTSEFGPNAAVGLTISGTVFEDADYGGGAGRDRAASGGVGRPGARVELYDAGGAFVTFTTTDGSGDYALTALAAGTYTVRVVNAGVSSSRPGWAAGLLPVQTYRTDAAGGTAVAVTDHVGGQDPTVADAGDGGPGTVMDTATGVFTAGISGTAQSITNVAVAGSNVTGVDFGFNFDTIVNTNDDGQGSLRQFLLNAVALGDEASLAQSGSRKDASQADEPLPAATETSIFMVSDGNAHPGLRAALPDQLTGGVAAITVLSALPPLSGASASDTVIDATTQTVNVGNTNPAVLGTGGTVGVDGLPLPQGAGPEVEVTDGAGLAVGIDVQADGAVIRGLAVYGFGSGNSNGNIRVGIDGTSSYTGIFIEDNVIRSTADSFTDPDVAAPGTGTEGSGIVVLGVDDGTIRRNLVGYAGRMGVYLVAGADDWDIHENEVRRNGLDSDRLDGIGLTDSSTRAVVTQNLSADNQGAGVDFFQSLGTHTVENNTIEDNGWGGTEPVGVRMFSSGSTIRLNLIRNQTGAGVLAVVEDLGFLQTPAIHNRITENHFSGNGSNAIDLQATLDVIAPGDGITLNDGTLLGDSSVPNPCGIVAAHGNEGLDTPIVDLAIAGDVTTTVFGRACPGSDVEIYRAVADGDASDTLGGNDYGEGVEYLATTTAAPVTGAFSITTVPGLTPGDQVTAIAIDSDGNTSEFSANIFVGPPSIVKRGFLADGTPLAGGTVLPRGTIVKFLLYINNPGDARNDVTVRDILVATFGYQLNTIQVDNTLDSAVVCPSAVCDEDAIFAQVDGSGTAVFDDPSDGDVASYTAGITTIDLGNEHVGTNAQLDLAAGKVWAVVFTVRISA